MIDKLLEDYKPSNKVAELVKSSPIVLLAGITAAGKGTLKEALLKDDEFIDFISYTTRPPRMNHGIMEQNGVEYRFVTRSEMESMLRDGEMIEAKQYSGNVYGTGATDLRSAKATGKVAVNDVEVQGVREYMRLSSEVKAIFVLPPSYKEWQSRLDNRYKGSDQEKDNMRLRIQTAKVELRNALDAGYFTFVINNTVERMVEDVRAIVKGDWTERDSDEERRIAQQLFDTFSTH